MVSSLQDTSLGAEGPWPHLMGAVERVKEQLDPADSTHQALQQGIGHSSSLQAPCPPRSESSASHIWGTGEVSSFQSCIQQIRVQM